MRAIHSITIAAMFVSLSATAGPYVLSSVGNSVVRLESEGTVAAGSVISALFPSGWTASSGSGGSMSVTSYNAGFSGGTGGGEIKALFNLGSTPPAGSYQEWVQVITTNAALGGNTSPYLDNASDTSKPFYSLTAANTTPGLPAGQLNFYDFSKRSPSLLATTSPITWSAALYPVIADASNALTVYDGVSWGWSMKRSPVGNSSATFTSPAPSSAVTAGVGTNTFSWGVGDPSWVRFDASSVDTTTGTLFKLGTLTFHNGIIFSGAANGVDMNIGLHFDNVSELDSVLTTLLDIVNTPNTDDPIASADTLSLGVFGYTFNVLEGFTASVDVMGMLSTGLAASIGGTQNGAALAGQFPFDPLAGFSLRIAGLINPTAGSFVGTTPEPNSVWLTLLAMCVCWRFRQRASAGRS